MTGADAADRSIVETHFTGAGTVLVSRPYEFSRQGKETCILLYDCTTEKASGVRVRHILLKSILASVLA
jgi:hypothetical protein